MDLAKLELWALRSAAILAALALIAWRLIAYGENKVQVKWDNEKAMQKQAEEIQSARNKLESTLRQGAVDMAEASAAASAKALQDYRNAHPVTGTVLASRLCPEAFSDSANACKGAGDSKAVAACISSRVLQQDRERNSRAAQLDELWRKSDELNENYRVCLATRPPPTATKDQGSSQ